MKSSTTWLASSMMSVLFASGAMAQAPKADVEARNAAVIRRHHDAINAGERVEAFASPMWP